MMELTLATYRYCGLGPAGQKAKPNGRSSLSANTLILSACSPVLDLNTLIRRLVVDEMKMSPLGALAITRPRSGSVAHRLTANFSGTDGSTPCGRGTVFGLLPALALANGGGRSAMRTAWMRPGWSSLQCSSLLVLLTLLAVDAVDTAGVAALISALPLAVAR